MGFIPSEKYLSVSIPICVYLRLSAVSKKTRLHGRGGFTQSDATKQRDWKTRGDKIYRMGFIPSEKYLSVSIPICVYLRLSAVSKKNRLHGRGGFTQSDATKQRDWKTCPYSALLT
jgi:hypothetical protein